MTVSEGLDPATHVPLTEQFVGPTGHPLLPGGFGRGMMAVAPWAPMVARGEGCWIIDEDDRRVLDMNNNFTANILGNAHPDVVQAISDAAADGCSFGMSHRYEIRHGERLLRRFPAMDQVRYVNSGTEATMLAIRVARAATGRDPIVVVRGSYHGWNDTVLPTGGPHAARGVPKSTLADTLVVPFDDVDALQRTVRQSDGRIAAIVLDLLPNRVGMVPPSDEFIDAAASLAYEFGAALIVDEVVSFRLHTGGLTTARSVPADMVALGKTIGGGLAAGAVVGKARWMRELDVFSSTGLEGGGTCSANPPTMAAGSVVLDLLDESEIARLARLGDRFRAGLATAFATYGWEPRGQGSLSRLYPLGLPDSAAVAESQRRLWWAAYERGIFVAKHGVAAISTPMTEEIIDDAAAALSEAVAVVQKADQS
ncbi:aspartate aminotransferase family protein [Rhodococcus koreensis]